MDWEDYSHGFARALLFSCAITESGDDPDYFHQGEMGPTIDGLIDGLSPQTRADIHSDAVRLAYMVDRRALEQYAAEYGDERAGEVACYAVAGHGIRFSDDGDWKQLDASFPYGEVYVHCNGEPHEWIYGGDF